MNIFGNESKEEVSNLEKQMGRKRTVTAGDQVHRSAHCTVLHRHIKSSSPETAQGLQDYWRNTGREFDQETGSSEPLV